LKGRYFWEKRSPEGLKKAGQYFQQAIRLDPRYALAYAGLSRTYDSSIWFILGTDPREAARQAKLAAAKAIELDDTLAEAHVAMAAALASAWDIAGSLRHNERALALSPDDAEAHHHYAYTLVLTGRADEAVAEIKHALELDPLSVAMNVDVGEILLYARRYDEAIEALKHALEMDDGRENAHWDLGLAHEQKGRFDEAITEYLRAATIRGGAPSTVAEFKAAYAAAGLEGYWRKQREAQDEEARQGYLSPYYRAEFAARCGQTDAAFAWLEKAYAEHSPLLINLKADALLDPLRGDPRFSDLLRRVGLPE
jgi:tetratricopeptide (TPR) repeat protein